MRLALVLVFLAASVGGTCVSHYSTTFPVTQYPLSEGGRWVQRNPGGPTSFNRLEAFNGVAYQTYDFGYYDGVAHLTGFFPDQWIEGTFHVKSGYAFHGVSEGTLAVRMTTRPTHTQANPHLESYNLAYAIWGSPPSYQGFLVVNVWDGHAAQLNEPNTFYGQLGGGQLHGHADCSGPPRNGDRVRFTVQGRTPPRLNAYVRRNDGSPAWIRCQPHDIEDHGASSITTLPSYGPSWHTPLLTGNPGITSFQNNDSVRTQGFTEVTAGHCPEWPASCAP
jgi:hypothetical protein